VLTLFFHPFSSYCQKVLIALYENGAAFERRILGPDDPAAMDELRAMWPIGKFPLLVDEGAPVIEASSSSSIWGFVTPARSPCSPPTRPRR
jgi:glutathione S-transferase